MEPDHRKNSTSRDLLGEDEIVDYSETSTYSFIVKIWLEDTADEVGQATWRGRIIQVPSGKERYLENLKDIGAFILPFLEKMGVRSENQLKERDL